MAFLLEEQSQLMVIGLLEASPVSCSFSFYVSSRANNMSASIRLCLPEGTSIATSSSTAF